MTPTRTLGAAIVAGTLAGLSAATQGASHSDAPLIKQDPQANITDVYTKTEVDAMLTVDNIDRLNAWFDGLGWWAPAVFVRLGLAEAGEGPEVSISVNKESIMKG